MDEECIYILIDKNINTIYDMWHYEDRNNIEKLDEIWYDWLITNEIQKFIMWVHIYQLHLDDNHSTINAVNSDD